MKIDKKKDQLKYEYGMSWDSEWISFQQINLGSVQLLLAI